jgi:plastocyanin
MRVFLPLHGTAADSVWHPHYPQPSIESALMSPSQMLSKATLVAAVALASIAVTGAAKAQSATEIQLSYKDKKFDPAEISAPANTPIVIKLKNLDAKPMEFESKTLKIEKVVAAGGDATINVRAQKPGRYEFFDEYNEKVARGALVVK